MDNMKVSELSDRIKSISEKFIHEINMINKSVERFVNQLNSMLYTENLKVELKFNDEYQEPEWKARIIVKSNDKTKTLFETTVTLNELKNLDSGSFVDTTEQATINYYSSFINLFSKGIDEIENEIK